MSTPTCRPGSTLSSSRTRKQRVHHAIDAWESLEDIIVGLLGPLWRRHARLLDDQLAANKAVPLTPAPFESQPSIRTPTPASSHAVQEEFVTFDPGRAVAEPAAPAAPAPEVVTPAAEVVTPAPEVVTPAPEVVTPAEVGRRPGGRTAEAEVVTPAPEVVSGPGSRPPCGRGDPGGGRPGGGGDGRGRRGQRPHRR